MAAASQGCPMVTIPLPLDYQQQHKMDDTSVMPLHHPTSEQSVRDCLVIPLSYLKSPLCTNTLVLYIKQCMNKDISDNMLAIY